MVPSKFEFSLHGRCDLSIDGQPSQRLNCELELNEQHLICYIVNETISDAFSAAGKLDASYKVTNLVVFSPTGVLRAATVPVAFPARADGGQWSVHQTPLSYALGINASVRSVSFIINEVLEFMTEDEAFETMFLPGFELSRSMDLGDGIEFVGSKDFVSFRGALTDDDDIVRTSLGLAIGAPAVIFSTFSGKRLSIHLNNYRHKARVKARPLVFRGKPFLAENVASANIRDVYIKCSAHLNSLSAESRDGMINAVHSFLQGRVLHTSMEVKLLAAYHFLEWFDGSRTLSPNQVANKLSILRDEAAAICDVRNGLVHNRKLIDEILTEGAEKILSSGSDNRVFLENVDPPYGFLNYLYSVLGTALLRRVGYQGKVDTYLPLI